MNISKKAWVTLLIIGFILIIILLVINARKNSSKPNTQNETNNIGEMSQNITQEQQGKVVISDVSITSDGSVTNVSAQVTNNDTKAYSIVEVSIIFYDSNNVVLTTSKGLIEKLTPNSKKGFSSSIAGNFSKSFKYEVKVEQAK